MLGDQGDILGRLRTVLPPRWFPDTAPVLDGLLSGVANIWAAAYAQLQFVRAQTRIATATETFLDMIAADFFGVRLRRRVGQDDDSLRRTIGLEMLRERATRGALQRMLEDLTGRTPVIFEPTRPADTRGWGVACGWGVAGGWGSLSMPFQCLVTAYRPQDGGISRLSGWDEPAGSWGGGSIGYISLSMVGGLVSDDEIAAAVAGVMPVATTAWMRISN